MSFLSHSLQIKLVFRALAVAAALSALLPSARGQIVTLNDLNSSASVNLGSQAGMYQWQINGQNQLNQQWFWYRADGDATQNSINTIGNLTYSQTAPNTLDATYTSPGRFSIDVTYTLSGSNPGTWTSDITENISISNLSGSSLGFHFFQYSDFALAGTSGNEMASILKNDANFFTKANVTKAANQLSETIDQPLANEAEADIGTATLNRLNSGSPYTLNNNLNSGPDPSLDATWALEWDFTLDPMGGQNDTVDVIKDKKLSVAPVPEPTALSLVALGGAAFFLRRMRSSV